MRAARRLRRCRCAAWRPPSLRVWCNVLIASATGRPGRADVGRSSIICCTDQCTAIASGRFWPAARTFKCPAARMLHYEARECARGAAGIASYASEGLFMLHVEDSACQPVVHCDACTLGWSTSSTFSHGLNLLCAAAHSTKPSVCILRPKLCDGSSWKVIMLFQRSGGIAASMRCGSSHQAASKPFGKARVPLQLRCRNDHHAALARHHSSCRMRHAQLCRAQAEGDKPSDDILQVSVFSGQALWRTTIW